MSQAVLLKKRKFYPLFWTQFFGAFNDNFLKNAMVILVMYKAGTIFGFPSSQMVAVAGGIFILPFFLFSATAGQLADKYDKDRLIRIVKTVEIGIMSIATTGFLLKQFSLLLIALFLMGLHSTFFGPLKYSILPQHLDEDELVGGNAMIEAGTFLAILIGTILGGVLIALPKIGPQTVSMGLVAVAVSGYFMSRFIPKAAALDPALKVEWFPIRPTIQILKTARANRSVFLSIMGISWFWFFGGALLSLFPPYCKDILKGNESLVTLFLALFSVGVGIGSLLCERLSRKRLELGLVPLGSIGLSLFTLDLFFQGTPKFHSGSLTLSLRHIGALAFLQQSAGRHIAIDLLLLSVFGGFYTIPLYTLIQERAEPALRSRIIAANNIWNAIFMVVASVFLVVMMRFGFNSVQIFCALGILNGVAAIYIYSLLPEFLIRFGLWIIGNLLYRLRVFGDEQVPQSGPALLVCNHVSFVDWLIISAAIKRPVRFVMDHSFAKGFLFKLFLKQAKVITIATARENVGVLNQAFKRIAEELRDGELVCIFPEGALTRDGSMRPFKPGVEKIITDTPVPVVPMAIQGLWGSFFSREPGAAFKKPKKLWAQVSLIIGSPVAPERTSAADLFERVSALQVGNR